MTRGSKSQFEALNRRVCSCRRCPRLVAHREEVARTKRRAYRDQEYWGKPVPGFGDLRARIVLVGLAPGAHGSNRTGRMFTGDASGDFLFPALHRAGLCNRAEAVWRDDGLRLKGCYITAAVRCAPPGNRPTPTERANCREFLAEELALLSHMRVCLCLGHLAFEEVQRAFGDKFGGFAHGRLFEHTRVAVLCSYHVSRQNTQTGRLTARMFDAVLAAARRRAGI